MHVPDAYFATLRENKLMERMNLGDHDISDDTLRATGLTASQYLRNPVVANSLCTRLDRPNT
jgi:hypothetical protein